MTATDPHGVSSVPRVTPVGVYTPPFPNAWTAAPSLTGSRRLAVGLNANGTRVCLGELPIAVSAVDAAGNVSPRKTGSPSALTLPVITHAAANEPSTLIQGSALLYTLARIFHSYAWVRM